MGQRELDTTESLLQELLWTYGPCGQEDAVRDVCARELQPLVDDMWTDDAGNLIGYIGAAENASCIDRPPASDESNRRRAPQRGSWHTWTSCPCWSSGSSRTAPCT